MKRFRRNRFGFSLLEILIALGILAGSVGVFLSRAQNSSRMAIEDEREFVAVTLASNKMVDLERDIEEDLARGKLVDEQEQTGDFEEPFEEYVWTYVIRKVEIPVADTGAEGQSAVAMGVIKNIMKEISKSVREVTLTVSWGDKIDKEYEHSYSLTTHVVNIK